MNKINIKDINFDALKKVSHQENNIYKDNNHYYKLLCRLTTEEKDKLYNKILNMQDIKINNMIFPIDLIMNNNELEGYTTKNFDNFVLLPDKFKKDYFLDCNIFFKYLLKATEILKEVHKNEIICGNLSFNNFLINKNGDIILNNIENCCYKDDINYYPTQLLKNFLFDFRNEEFEPSYNTDRICMVLELLQTIFIAKIQDISSLDYYFLEKKVCTLNNLKEYLDVLLNKKTKIPTIPYLDKIIYKYDDYIIDRYNLSKKKIK